MEFNKLTYLQVLRGAKLTHAEYRVLVTILTYSNSDGTNAHPGYARLAGQCHMSKSTVTRCVNHLKQLGWLWETTRGVRGRNSQIASVLELRIPRYLTN